MNKREATISVEAVVDEIDAVTAFIDELLENVPCSTEARTKLDMAVEEIFVNIARYAYGEDGGKTTVYGSVSLDAPYPLTLTFEDSGREFNPLEREKPNLTPAVRRHTIGGLGIFLARSMTDEIRYERRDGKNRLTIEKNMT